MTKQTIFFHLQIHYVQVSFHRIDCAMPTLSILHVVKFFPYKEETQHFLTFEQENSSGWLSTVLNRESNLAGCVAPEF